MNYTDKALISKAKRHCKKIEGAVAYVTDKGRLRLNELQSTDKVKYTLKVVKGKQVLYDSKGKKISPKLQDAPNVAANGAGENKGTEVSTD